MGFGAKTGGFSQNHDILNVNGLFTAGGNAAPIVVNPITNQAAVFNSLFTFTFPDSTFLDPDGNPLTYTATGLPLGILLDGPKRTFSGTPTATTIATPASLIGTYPIVPAGGVADNYTFGYTNSLLTVTKASLLVVGDATNRPYGRPNPAFSAVVTGVTNGDNITVSFSTTVTNTSPPGDYKIALIMVDPAGKLSQYDLRLRSAYLTVTPGPLTGTVASVSRPYGGTNPVFAVTYAGFQNGDGSNVLSGELTYTCADTNGVPVSTNTPVGIYPIRVTCGQTATNYAVSYVDGTLTITPAELTVTAVSTNRVYGAANPALTGTVTGQVNGDNLTASFASAATLATPVGVYNIVPVWADPDGKLGNYTVTTNLGTLTITTASLTVDVGSRRPARDQRTGLLRHAPGHRCAARTTSCRGTSARVGAGGRRADHRRRRRVDLAPSRRPLAAHASAWTTTRPCNTWRPWAGPCSVRMRPRCAPGSSRWPDS